MSLPDPVMLDLRARIYKTMAHPIRLAMIEAFRDGERSDAQRVNPAA